MEHPAVWDAVAGGSPASNAELDFRFAESLHRKFPGLAFSKPARDAYAGMEGV
jgi:hypothetical protein